MRLCLIGNCGHALQLLCEGLPYQDTQLVGLSCASTEDDMDAAICILAQKSLFPVYYMDWRAMLDAQKPDAVLVDTVFDLHCEITGVALARGIAVLCEKPLALTLGALDTLQEIATRHQMPLWAMQTLRYEPWVMAAREQIQAGELGNIRMISVQKSYKLGRRPAFYAQRARHGGLIPWVAIHAIDAMIYLSQSPVKEVYARHCRAHNGGNGNLEMSAVCVFTMENGCLADLHVDYFRPENASTHGDDQLRIVGTQAILEGAQHRLFRIGQSEIELPSHKSLLQDFIDHAHCGGGNLDTAASLMSTRLSLLARQSADQVHPSLAINVAY